jgi:DNA-binding transcriptional ArsR family regulator
MVHYQEEQRLDRAFAALADPTRRGMLERVSAGSASIGELAAPFGITLTGARKHVRVLEEAELMSTEKVGRTRLCSLGPRRLDDLQEWIDGYRRTLAARLDRLDEFLKETKGEQR